MFFLNNAAGSNGLYPYCTVSSSNTDLVYSGATSSAGPFNSQKANVDGWVPDQLKVSFVCTQAALTAQGKVTCGVYYSPPNQSFIKNGTGTFDGTLTKITAADILNTTQSARVYSVP